MNEYNHIKPIKQNKRSLGPDRSTAACKEAEELKKAGILQKVKHQTWIANPIMVKKNDGGWRMCVDFTDINKACPKDCYPLPEIDWKIESLAGFCLKCFLDAYKGYHQIQMAEGDGDKITFFVGERVFCYRKMPFDLKNTEATYQRLVDKVFNKQIERNLEAYVDDMVIKSTSEEGMLSDIQETFERFQSINMKLNLKKCSFGVEEGLFLGYLITKQGIKAKPYEKSKAITSWINLRALKDIQSLNGKLAALSRFLSKGAERSLPFFKGVTRGRTQLPCTRKAYIGIGACSKKASKILLSSHDNGSHRDERETPADFLPEIPFDDSEKKVKEKEVSDPSNEWKLYTNRASSPDGAGAGLMLIDPAGKEYTYALRFEFETTNNEAEYEALLVGLRIAQEMEITKVAIFIDSQLVVNQIKGTYAAKQLSIKSYLQKNYKAGLLFGYLCTGIAAKGNSRLTIKQGKSTIWIARGDESIAVRSDVGHLAIWGIHILGPLPMALGDESGMSVATIEMMGLAIDQAAGGKPRDKNAEESWALLEDLAFYDNKSWNDPRDFGKLVKAISLPQDVILNKITSSCKICSGPYDTQYCMENPEQAFVDYTSSCTDEAGDDKPEEKGIVNPSTKDDDCDTIIKIKEECKESEEKGKEEKGDPENINANPPSPPDLSISFIIGKNGEYEYGHENGTLHGSTDYRLSLWIIKKGNGQIVSISTKGNQDSRRRDAWNSGNKDGRRSGKQEDSKALVTIDGEGVDWTSHSEEEEDYALMACNSSGSDTEVTSCSKECKESYAKLKKLYDAQREQLGDASIEIQAYTQALKKVEAQLVAHQQGQLWYEEKIRFMKIDLDDKTDVLTYHKKLLAEAEKEKEDLKAKVEKWHNSSKNLSILLNSQMSANDKFGLGFVIAEGMHVVPPPMTGNYMPSGPDIEIDYSQFTYGPKQSQASESETQTSDFDTCDSNCSDETHESLPEPAVNEPKVVSQPKVWSDAPIIEEYESDSEDEHVSLPTEEHETPSFANKQVKTPRETVKNQFTHSKNPKVDKKGLGYGFTTKACFVCGSLSHLIRDCDFHEKRMAKQAELNNRMRKKSSQREIRPIWNNVQRMNHRNQFVPKAVLTRTGKILVNTARASGTNTVNTARHNVNRQAVPTNAANIVNTVKPIVNNARPKSDFHKSVSPFRKSLNRTTALRTNFSYQKVNTAEVNAVSAVGGKRETAVKPSAGCNWRPKRHYWHKDYPHRALQNKGIIDSGCSRHMTGNKAYLAEYQDFNGGPVAFGGSKGYITGKGKIKTGKLDFEDVCFVKELQHFNLFSVSQICDKKNKVLFTDSECLVLSPEFKLPDANQDFVLPIWSSYTSIVKSSKAKNAGEEPNKNPDLKTDEKPVDKEDQVFLDELERLKRQEQDANDAAEPLRKEFAKDTKDLLLQAGAAKASSTNTVNTASTLVSTASPYGRLSFTNTDQDDSEIPALEDMYDHPTDETIVNVSLIPTSRINSIHPSTLILGDPNSAVQTRSKVTKSSLEPHAFILVRIGLMGRRQLDKMGLTENKKDEKVLLFRHKARSTPRPHHLIWRKENLIDAYSDSDYAGANLDKKSTTGGCQFLGRRLISWQCKKQTIVATSTTEAEYVLVLGSYYWDDQSINCIYHRDEYDLYIEGTEDLLFARLVLLWFTKVSTDSAKLIPLGKDSTAIKTLEKIPPRYGCLRIMPKHNSRLLEKTGWENRVFIEINFFLLRAPFTMLSLCINKEVIFLFDELDGIDFWPNQAIFEAIANGRVLGENHGRFSHPKIESLSGELRIKPKKLYTWKARSRSLKETTPVTHTLKLGDEEVLTTKASKIWTIKETDKAQDVGRTSYVVHEEKESAEKGVSTEDPLSTAQPKVSTDKPEDSTDKPDEEEVLLKQLNRQSTPTIFCDEATLHKFLINNEPSSNIDQRDKGKKMIEEEDESDTDSEDITEAEKKFKQLARDEEVARKVQEDWEAEEEVKKLNALYKILAEKLQEEEREMYTIEQRAKFLHDTIAAQRRFLAQQRSEAIRNKPPSRNPSREPKF
ncbi:ribonuclease H-like domain-containing protein [Tanacetum coccineum]